MRKQRKDSSRNRLSPEQQVAVEDWLFIENIGYAEVVKRLHEQFGVAMSVAGVSRLYHYFARMRQARELVEAHVKMNRPEETPASEDELRAVAMSLTTNAILHESTTRPADLKELLPYARLLLEGERYEIVRRKLKLAERCGKSAAKGAGS